jgi:hypothetical protein
VAARTASPPVAPCHDPEPHQHDPEPGKGSDASTRRRGAGRPIEEKPDESAHRGTEGRHGKHDGRAHTGDVLGAGRLDPMGE